jgi:peptide/nickel transport system substrate-binding protein
VPGLSFELQTINVDQSGNQVAQVIQQSLAEAGINVKLQPYEQGTFRSRSYLATGPAPFDAAITFTASFGDSYISLRNWSASKGLAVYQKFMVEDPEYTALFTKAGALGPGPERAAVFQQMCARIAETENIVPLVTKSVVVAYRSDLINANVPEIELMGDFVRFLPDYSRKT